MASQKTLDRALLKNFYEDPEAFAVTMNLIPDKNQRYQCTKCIQDLKIYRHNNSLFVCSKCRISISYLKGTLFENCNVSIRTILYLALHWSKNYTYDEIQDHPETFDISRDTIGQWFHKFRHIVVTEMAKNHEQNKIDDSAQNQQVKESSKFGKVLFNFKIKCISYQYLIFADKIQINRWIE